MKTAIILLNWNGADDTIDCLNSLSGACGDFFVVVVDNDSHDDSVERLKEWKDGHPQMELHLVEENENHGFAIGNNIGVRYASRFQPAYYLLLNNDTVVEPDFLVEMTSFMETHKDVDVVSPVINYYADKDKIWFGGGRLKYAGRTALHRGESYSVLKEAASFPIDYVSGCAMLFKPTVLTPSGDVFSDKFFFGEEDHEFSVRMMNRHQMACVTGSKVYHKIGMARKKLSKEREDFDSYIYYLSLYVIYGLHEGLLAWCPKMVYIYMKSLNKFRCLGHSLLTSSSLSHRLFKDYQKYKAIDRKCFEELRNRFLNTQS